MKIRLDTTPEHLFFTSDLHYSHANVIDLDNRPYNSVEEMEKDIEEKLKTTLTKDDILIDLGDMFFGSRNVKYQSLISSIPCPIYKVLGNHDNFKFFKKHEVDFKCLADILEIEINGQIIVASHYPILDFPHMYRGSIEVFGHTHGHLDKFIDSIPYLMIDLGFGAGFSRSRGTFIHRLDTILDYFNNKTGGKTFQRWSNEMYHGSTSLWS